MIINEASGDELFKKLIQVQFHYPSLLKFLLTFPPYNLPYYEGFNRYNDKYWLGIYRRDELFSIQFLKEICLLCLKHKSVSYALRRGNQLS